MQNFLREYRSNICFVYFRFLDNAGEYPHVDVAGLWEQGGITKEKKFYTITDNICIQDDRGLTKLDKSQVEAIMENISKILKAFTFLNSKQGISIFSRL